MSYNFFVIIWLSLGVALFLAGWVKQPGFRFWPPVKIAGGFFILTGILNLVYVFLVEAGIIK